MEKLKCEQYDYYSIFRGKELKYIHHTNNKVLSSYSVLCILTNNKVLSSYSISILCILNLCLLKLENLKHEYSHNLQSYLKSFS